MIDGQVTLCDIDNTIYINDFYIGTYSQNNDSSISFNVFMSGLGAYEGEADNEEEAIEKITSWLDY